MRRRTYFEFANANRPGARHSVAGNTVKAAALELNPRDSADFMRRQVGAGAAVGALAAGSGGLVAGHALGRTGSGIGRLIQGLLGAGLAYGGYRYMSDPSFRHAFNDYGRRLYEVASPYLRTVADKVKPVFDPCMVNAVGGWRRGS